MLYVMDFFISSANVQKASAAGGLGPPDRLPGLCPRTPLGDFHHPKLLIGQCLFWASLWESPALLPKKFRTPPKKIDETEEPEAQIHGWMTLTKNLVPICRYCLNCTHEMWSVDSQENP